MEDLLAKHLTWFNVFCNPCIMEKLPFVTFVL